jgi:DNA-binding response OmpR family regulator
MSQCSDRRTGQGPIELSPREMKVLSVLFRERGNAVSREALLNEVWGFDYCGTTVRSIN